MKPQDVVGHSDLRRQRTDRDNSLSICRFSGLMSRSGFQDRSSEPLVVLKRLWSPLMALAAGAVD
jgi:hypothetical protein